MHQPSSFRRVARAARLRFAGLGLGALASGGAYGAFGAYARPASVSPTPGPACGNVLAAADVAALGVPTVSRELRAAWVSPVDGGEWPSRPDMSPEAQRAELLGVLDRAAALGLNAVVLHVRMAADAIYPTRLAPWSSYLTRTGSAPDYDPLAFAVAEAHRRGLQLHAWFNPFRAATPDNRGRAGAAFIAREHPSWLVRYGSQTWIDPGIPEARRAVLEAMLEVVDRYDIDAVHLDDYFYPYQEERTIRRRVGRGKRRHTVVTHETIEFADGASWRRYGAGRFDSRGDWRRENVNALIASLYREVKARKPWVLVGISPFGIWRSGSPSGITGLDAYSEIYADSRKWLRQGWLDYVAPQLYWEMNGAQARFARLDAWWRSENALGRHVWPGLFTMRVASNGNPWSAAEIPAQIAALRDTRAATGESMGHVHFRLAGMTPSSSLGQRLATQSYATPAVVPASPWLGAAAPEAPAVGTCRDDSTSVTPVEPMPTAVPAPPPLRVTKDAPGMPNAAPTGEMAPTPHAALAGAITPVAPAPGGVPVRWWVVQLRDAAGTWVEQTLPGDLRSIPVTLSTGLRASYVAVTAISPTGVASQPTVVRVE
jgi:uncharacterized lipoprotein YddW (UPF0748 family)